MKRNRRKILGKTRQSDQPAASVTSAPAIYETTFEGLPARIVRKQVRNFSMRLDRDGVIRVTAPVRMPDARIAELIRQHWRWAENALARQERSMDGRTIHDFSDGQTVYLWGRPLSMRIASRGPAGERKSGVYVDGDTAVMVPKQAAGASADTARRTLSSEEGQAILKEWYRAETKTRLEERIPAMESLTGRHAEKWTVKDTRSQWGSCTAPRGQHARISICLWLAAFPVEALEYVMVHELCHIYEMSHSPKFWMYVERFMPDYIVRRRLLKR
jgi:predicted metal-dependent hydrolase